MKSESFIEDRIRWRAGIGGLPNENTYFWEAGEKPEVILPKEIGKPVLVSVASKNELIVICTRGAAVKNPEEESCFLYSNIAEVQDKKVYRDEKKEELRRIEVHFVDGGNVSISPEPFGPAFSIWNILLMLQRMSS